VKKKRYQNWTKRSLRAAIAAIGAMLANPEGEGDWPEDVTKDDLERAQARLQDRLSKWGGRP
jgi:hypothetical protein